MKLLFRQTKLEILLAIHFNQKACLKDLQEENDHWRYETQEYLVDKTMAIMENLTMVCDGKDLKTEIKYYPIIYL